MPVTPLPDLIAHFQRREKECSEEIDKVVANWNRDLRFTAKTLTEETVRQTCAVWEEERRIARDTAAWLQTVRNHGGRLAGTADSD